MRETKNFKRHEFICKCGCGQEDISQETVKKLQKARDILGKPIYAKSGCRCAAHNAAVGGKPGSSHIVGQGRQSYAADVSLVQFGIMHSARRYDLVMALLQAGFERFGIAESYIHVDDDPLKASGIWTY